MQTQTNTQSAYGPMPDVTARISSIKPDGALRARGTLNIGGHFIVRNVRLMEGKNGPYLAMPGYKLGSDGWQDHCYGLSKEFQAKMLATMQHAYEQSLSQTQAAVQRHDGQNPQSHDAEQAPKDQAEQPTPYDGPGHGAPGYDVPAYDAGQQMVAM